MDKKILKSAMKLINFRERSENELKDRLMRKGYNFNDIMEVACYLKENGLVDDRKFIYDFYIDYLNIKQKGPRIIREKLKQFRVDGNLVEDVECEVLKDIDIEKVKMELTKNIPEKDVKKVLYRNGF